MSKLDPLEEWARFNAQEVQEFIRQTGVTPLKAIEVVTLKNVTLLLAQYKHNMMKEILAKTKDLKRNEGDQKH